MPELDVVYEDERVLAVNKPAGRLVIPGRGPSPGEPLVRQAERHVGAKAFVVHRLDLEASGLVLFAKDAAAHRELCLQFEGRTTRKLYLAAVQGVAEKDGEIARPLKEFGSGRMGVSPEGKPSLTRYAVERRFKAATLLRVELITGRRHQIRVHLYSIGHPLLGDARYGRDRPVGGAPRLMLHAWELEFRPPGAPAGASKRLRVEPGADFDSVLNLL